MDDDKKIIDRIAAKQQFSAPKRVAPNVPEQAELDERNSRAERVAEHKRAVTHAGQRLSLRNWTRDRGKRYAECTLDSFEPCCEKSKTAKALVASLLVKQRMRDIIADGTNIVFYGPPGTGKDHLLAAMIRRLIEGGVEYSAHTSSLRHRQQKQIYWTSGVALCSLFRDFEKTEQFADRQRVPILAISDPVVSELTAFQAERYYELLDYRYNHQLATWLTCNVADSADLATRLTPQLADRIKDGAIAIHCNWESHRKPLEFEA